MSGGDRDISEVSWNCCQGVEEKKSGKRSLRAVFPNAKEDGI